MGKQHGKNEKGIVGRRPRPENQNRQEEKQKLQSGLRNV